MILRLVTQEILTFQERRWQNLLQLCAIYCIPCSMSIVLIHRTMCPVGILKDLEIYTYTNIARKLIWP